MAGRSMYKICEPYYLKCLDSNRNIHLVLLQMSSTLIGTGLLSPETMLFNRLIRELLPQVNTGPVNM